MLAGPTGGQVTGGDGNIQRPDDQTTNVHQHTDKLVVEWQSFNLTPEEIVNFLQPGSNSIVLNQILDGDMSVIRGQINANGHVILSNANGLYFGNTAQLSVGSLIASGHHLSTEDFLDGNLNFERQEGTSGRVINRGTINAATGGSVTLLGSQVENTGQIIAHAGRINMVVGERIALDFDGDGLMRFAVDEALLSNADGHESAILNQGELQANGGVIAMEGRVAQDIFSQVVNNEGVVRAGRIDNNGGEIRLVGSGGSTSSVVNTGQIDASAQDAQSDGGQITLHAEDSTLLVQDSSEIRADSAAQQGGQVHLLGDRIALTGDTLVDASGWLGGGEILVGGDLQGQNPDIQNAQKVVVTSQVNLHADAIHNGDGGRIIAWADDWTRFSGRLSARGGAEGGDGGFAEVSGKQQLAYSGFADLSAPHGQIGTLLLDPENIHIVQGTGDDDTELTGNDEVLFEDENGDTFEIGADTISNQTANVLLQATQDIIQASDAAINITEQGIGITLQAGRDIELLAGITTNGGHITLEADSADQPGGTDGTGTVTITDTSTGLNSNGGDITLSGAELDITQAIEAGAGNVSMTATDVIQLGANISSTGNQTYTGAVTLTDSVILTATDSTILFESTVDGAESLTLAAGPGAVTFEGEVGGNTALDSLSITAGSIELEQDVTTAGNQDYNGAVTLTGNRTLEGNTLIFSDTVTGDDNNLTITGDLDLQGALTNVANLEVTDNATLAADVATTGNQTYSGAVTLTDSITLTTTDSNILFGGSIDGATAGDESLTLDVGDGTVAFSGEVGGDTELDSLDITADSIQLQNDVTTDGDQAYHGAVDLTGALTLTGSTLTFTDTVTGDDNNLTIVGDLDLQGALTDVSNLSVSGTSTLSADITTSGTQTYNSAITLTDSITLTTTDSNIDFGSTIDGAHGLTLAAGTGTVTLEGEVGAGTALDSLEITAGSIELEQDVTTAGNQDYNGAVTLTGNRTLEGNTLIFSDTVTGDDNNLTITGDLDLQGALTDVADLEVTGSSTLGADVTTTGSQTYTGSITLTDSVTLTADNSDITLQSSLDGSGNSLGINVGAGNIEFQAINDLQDLEVTADLIQLGQDITAAGDQTYNGAVSLTGNLTLTGNTVAFSETVTGNDNDLTIAADLDLQGAMTDVADLEVTGSSTLGADVTTTGNQTYTGAVTLEDGDRQLAGAEITFSDTVTGSGDNLTITGDLDLQGDMTSVANLEVSGASTLGADITTSGNQTYSGAVTLDDDIITLSSNNGNITFDSDITGNDNSLELDASNGNIDFQAINGLQDLEITAAQIELGQDITTSGSQTYNGAVTLTNSITLTTTDSNILFGGSIDGTTAGDESLTLAAGTGTVTLEGEVGADTALDSLEITAGSIGLEQDVTTAGNQDYNGAVTLTGNRTLEGNTLTFLDTVTGDGSNLAVTGSLELHDATSNIGDLTITGDLNLQGAMTDVADLEVTGASTLGANVTTTGNQTYSGAVSLDDDTIILSSNNGNITFDNDITGNDNSLELDASNGNIEFQAINGLQDLELTANLIQLGQDITTSGNQTYNSAVSLTNSITLTGDTVAFSDTVTGNDNDLTVAGDLDLQGEMTGVAELEVTGSSTLGADVTTTGTQTYNGAVTLAGQRELAGTLLNFGDLLTGDGSNLAVTGNLELHDATSNIGDLTITGNLDLQGAITDVANLEVTGTSTLGADVTTTGSQTYSGAVTLTESVTLTATDSNILFEDSIDGTNAGDESLTLAAGTGTVTFEGEVGGDTELDSLEITAGSIELEQDVTTSGNQNYNGAVTLTGNRTLDGTTLTFFDTVTSNDSDLTIAGDLNLQGAMTNVADLEVTGSSTLGADVTTTGTQTYTGTVTLENGNRQLAGAEITFSDAVTGSGDSLTITGNLDLQGAMSSVADLEVTGSSTLGADVTTTSTQTYTGAVTLTDSVALTATDSNILFENTVDGAESLTLTAGTGTVTFEGEVGADTALDSLEITAGSIELEQNVTTAGNQDYNGAATLTGNRTLEGNTLTFFNTVTSNDSDLTITGNLDLQGAITDVANLEVTGASTLGANITTTGSQTYSGAVSLDDDTITLSSNNGNITFDNDITGNDNSLELDASNGNIEFQAINGLQDLELTANLIQLGQDITTSGNQTYNSAVSLTNSITLTGNTVAFSDTVAGNNNDLTVAGDLDLQGEMTDVADLEVTDSSTLGADVNTTGNQTYGGTVTLAGQRELAGTLLNFGDLLTGDGSNLTVTGALELHDTTSNIGDLTIAGDLNLQGAITDVTNLEVTGTSTLGADVTTTGNQTYTGAVTLANGDRQLAGTEITFSDTVTGDDSDLTIAGILDLQGNMTAVADLEVTGSSTLGADVTTAGNQTYGGAVTLANGDRQLAGTEITFSDAVAGSGDNLTITGNLDLQGTMISVADLEVAGTSTLSADVTTTGNQTYTGAITLTDSITLITTDSDIEFGSTIDGAHELTLTAGTGTVTIGGDAGGDTALDSLDITAGSIELEQDVTTSGNQTYNGAVTLTGSRTLEGTLLHFGNLLTGDGSNLAVTGNLELHDATSNIGDLTVNGNLDLQGAITDVANLEIIGSSNLGADVTTTGTQAYTGAVTLTDNITLTTTNSDIEFGSTIDGAHELTLTAGTGTVTLDGEAGGDTALASLEISAGDIQLGQNITTSGTQTYNDAVTLTDSVVLTTTNSDITFLSPLTGGGNSLGLNVGSGNIGFQEFNGLQDLEITADQIELGEDIITGGNQTYNSAVTLTDSITLTGTTIAFSETVAGDGNNLTIEGNLDLQSAMTNVADLDVSGTSVLGADVTTTGNQTYNGAVTLANGHRQLEGSEITFSDTVNGNGNGLTIDGDLNLQGAISGVADLQVNGASALAADVTTSGSQTYNGTIELNNSINLTSTTSDIDLQSALNGNNNSLTLNANNGSVEFGEVNDLDNLTIDAGTIEFGNDEISTTGNQSYTGAVNLTNNITLTTANSNITFVGAVDGEYSLTLDTGSGDIDTSDAVVGGDTPLEDLTITEAENAAFGAINLDGDFIQVKGTGTTILSEAIDAANINLTVSSLTLDGISLDTSSLDGESDGNITLNVDELLTVGGGTTINAGTGTVELAPSTAGNTIYICRGACASTGFHTRYDLGDLSITADTIRFGNTDHEGEITLDGISFDYELQVLNENGIVVTGDLDGTNGGALVLDPGSGITRLDGGSIRTQFDQTYESEVRLSGDFVLETYEGDITFTGLLGSIGSGTDPVYDLTLNTDFNDDGTAGNIFFQGVIERLNDLTIETANNVDLAGTVDIAGAFDLENATGKLSLVNGLNLTAANIYLNALEIDFENGDPIKLITEDNNGDIDLITDNLTIGGELELNAGTGNITLATQSTNSSLGLCSGASCAGTGTYDALYNIGAGFSFNTDANFQVGQAGHTGDITLYGFDADYDLSLANTGNGKITLAGAFSSTHSLTLSSGSGGIEINDAINLQDGDLSLTAHEGNGTIDLGSDIQTGTGNQTYNGAITLTDSVSLTTADGNITFESSIDGGHALSVNAGAGDVDFQGMVGDDTELASLDVTAANIAFSDISTNGDLTLSSANNLDFATDTELTAGDQLTLAINQAGNPVGVTLDLNDLILNSNDILLQGGGSDSLQGHEDVSNSWLISGSTDGRIDNNHLNNGADFTGFSEVLGGDQGDDFEITGTYNGDITGGAGDDEIRRVGNGQINGQIDGGGGTNTYDVSGTSNPVTLTWGQGFTNIQTLIGDGDILRGSATQATDWNLTDTDGGELSAGGNSASFEGFTRLISGSGGANTFESNGQYNGTIELRGGDNNWHFTPGQRLTRGQVVGNGTLFIAQRDDGSAGTVRLNNDDLYLPVLTGFNGNLFIGGKVNPGTLPLDGGFNSIEVNANRLVVDNAVQTGGNLVLLGSEIDLTGAPITSGGQVSFVSVGSFCNICGNLTGSGNLRVGQETQVQAQGGQVIAAGGITQSDNLVLNFNGGDFELAVSQGQRETSQPNALSNVRGINLRSSTQAFINRLGLELVSVSVNFANPAASVLGVQAVEVIDLALFEEDLTLFGQLGEGVALAFAQCEEVEGCTPDVTDEELVASIDELQERIDQLEQELVVTSDPDRRQQLETLLADFRSQQAEFMAYREDLQAFTGFEELLDEEFDTIEEIDMEAVERELEAIETIYTRVRFLENLQYNSERRAQFSESTGLDLSEDRLNAIIESTLESAARAEARLERLLDGE
ncbi:filamentous hemagglutinin N-terminal domain-containing protein [Natronospirillum operosum]|uniref:two-partner secretion domain-containing protein n=1 Tax=Natronospirillum operosum TaxID=2759953 RepID=UPI001436AE0E|nr:filamentous hemagglutinin N-terminal domain-containing protein [Natronospirillum operosum]